MDITNILSDRGTNFLNPTPITRETGKKSLGVDDFLKLLSVQFTSQDPLKPMEDTQFISQMASFTSLEQMQTLSQDFAAFSKSQSVSTASSYLGKQVTVTDSSAPLGTVTGIISAVAVDATEGPQLTLNGKSYPLSAVQSLALAANN